MQTAYNIAKTFIVFTALSIVYALVSGTYTNDMAILAVIFLLAGLTALATAFAIFRASYERIAMLRSTVIQQFLEFARIWAPTEYQERVAAACTPSRDLRPAQFTVLLPVYGTMDELIADFRRYRSRRARRRRA